MSKRNSTTRPTSVIPTGRHGRRGLLLTVLGTVLTVSATSCGSETGAADSEESGDGVLRIGLSLPNVDSDFHRDLLAGARAEAEIQGATLSLKDAGNDDDQQGKDLRQFSAQGVDSVVLTPVNAITASAELRQLTGDGIPAVTAGRQADTAAATAVVTSDHAPSGRIAADALATAVNNAGNVVVLRGPKDNTVRKGHYEAFQERMKAHKKISVTATRSADFNQAKAETVMTELLTLDPSIDGVFAENDAMALGAAKAVDAFGTDNVSIVGFEGTGAGRKAVRSGELAATVTEQPEEMGRVAVRNAVRAAKGEMVENRILVPLRVVTKSNVKEFD